MPRGAYRAAVRKGGSQARGADGLTASSAHRIVGRYTCAWRIDLSRVFQNSETATQSEEVWRGLEGTTGLHPAHDYRVELRRIQRH